MDSSIVVFEPNVPVIIKLQYPEGLPVAGRGNVPRVMFTLEDGRRMFLDKPVADSIKMCDFRPGQPFTITKRVNGSTVRWDVNPISEQASPPPIQPGAPRAQGNGTHGPAPQAQTRPAAVPPTKVPMNVAFGEIVAFVNQELKYRGEQWNDEARQAAACTLLIQAGREGWLALWERK